MSKDGVRSDGHEDPGVSSANCNDCFWYKNYLSAKAARSAARYHAVSRGHRSRAAITRDLYFVKETGDGSNS